MIMPDAGTFRPLRMEPHVMAARLGASLYSCPESALREFLANEITAAHRARALGGTPAIRVAVGNDTVQVWGIDSLGIDRETFEGIYMCLGRTGNDNPGTPGQFGLGRLAYTAVADRILVETHPRGEPPYAFVGVAGRGYKLGGETPDIPVGTRVTMYRNSSDAVQTTGMLDMGFRVASHSDIPIEVTGPPDIPLDNIRERCRRAPPEEGDLTGESDGVGWSLSLWGHGRAYLCGMPISFTYRGRNTLREHLTVEVRDERRYPPTMDRERFTVESEEAISRVIDAELEGFLGGLTEGESLAHPARGLLAWLRGSYGDRVAPVYGMGMRRVHNLTGEPVLNCRIFERAVITPILEEYPKAVFVKGCPELESAADFLARSGLRRAAPRVPDEMVLHFRGGSARVPRGEDTKYSILGVRDGAELNRMRPLLWGGTIALTLKPPEGTPMAADALRGALGRTWETSRGDMTGSAMVNYGMPVYRTGRRGILRVWPGPTVMAHDPGSIDWELLIRRDGNIRRTALGGAPPHWTEAGIEGYLTLDTPVYREAVALCGELQRVPILNRLLALEGKEPLGGTPSGEYPESMGGREDWPLDSVPKYP